MKDSKFWRILASAAVAGLLLNAAAQWRAEGSAVSMAPGLDLFASAAYGQAPLVQEFSEQAHDFLAVWNTDDKGVLHYRVLRWTKGALRSRTTPELVQHVIFDNAGKMTVLLSRTS